MARAPYRLTGVDNDREPAREYGTMGAKQNSLPLVGMARKTKSQANLPGLPQWVEKEDSVKTQAQMRRKGSQQDGWANAG